MRWSGAGRRESGGGWLWDGAALEEKRDGGMDG